MKNNIPDCSVCDYRHPAISTLTDEESKLLSQHVVSVSYEKGEKLFKEHALNAHIIYIRSGLVKLHMKISEEKDQILRIMVAPGFLGLSTIFGDFINQYSATALEPSEACIMDITVFKELLKTNGAFSFEIMSDICKNELSNFTWHLNQSHKQSPGRLAGALLYLAEKVYQGQNFELTVSRNDIAEFTSISRENVTRTLTKFKEDGIISVQKNKIAILDMDALNKIFENI